MRPRTFSVVAALVGAAFLAAAYGADLGRGFVKDDAAWIATAVGAIHHPASAFAVDSSGYFFRPLVTASFAADYALHGTRSFGYGLTNVVLLAADVAALALLFAELGLGEVATAAGLLAWVLNPHGISMAVLWISGRTSLLMTLGSVLAVLAFLRNSPVSGALLLLAALFAKEDAIAVPVIACACAYAARRLTSRGALVAGAWMIAALAVYFALRLQTNAMTPATAPWYYKLLTSPSAIIVNAFSYLDRAGTSAAILGAVAVAIYGAPRWTTPVKRLLLTAAVWFVAGLAITVRIPVRSDLYAVFPSAGAALACAALVESCRGKLPASSLGARDRRLAIAAAALLLLVPVYRIRNARFVEPARLSALVQQRLAADLGTLPSTGTIVFEDTPARFSTFADAFDGMSSDAVRLFTGRPLTADIVTPPDAARRPGEVARYAYREGRVVRLH